MPPPRVATLKKINNINTSELIDEVLFYGFLPQIATQEKIWPNCMFMEYLCNKFNTKGNFNIDECRLAEPGEFTKLAFQNGKINLLKAEGIADLISSETEIQRRQAIKIMNGLSANVFNEMRENLLKILTKVEAKIDFPDEDLPKETLDK